MSSTADHNQHEEKREQVSLKALIQDVSTGHHAKDAIDIAATSAAIGAYLSWLPDIAAGLAALWTLIRIYEWVVEKFRSTPEGDNE